MPDKMMINTEKIMVLMARSTHMAKNLGGKYDYKTMLLQKLFLTAHMVGW
jgi:hypothetical protein